MSAASILERFRSCRGSLELFALDGKEALDLLASNPLAGFCLAINWRFHRPAVPWPMSAARFYMTKPQREILAWLGFTPASEAVAKIGRKCVPESLNINPCLRLRRALTRDEIRHLLAHLPRVNAGVIALITDPTLLSHVRPRLLIEVAENAMEDTGTQCGLRLADIRQMWRELRHGETLTRFSSLDQMRELHDELVHEINRHGVRWFQGRVCPPPPLPGMATSQTIITPITNVEELQALGRAQHNCVASYTRRILAGHTYIYRVTACGHVCTLAIARARGGVWRVSELRGACNRPAPGEAIRAVQQWLSGSQEPASTAIPDGMTDADHPAGLPPPQLAGIPSDTLEITPVTDVQVLHACGADLVRQLPQIEAGKAFAYRFVTVSERGVVLLARGHRSGWRIQQVRTDEGQRVRGETLVTVASWLGRAQMRFCW